MSTIFPPDTDEDGIRNLVTTFHGLHDWIEVSSPSSVFKQGLTRLQKLVEKNKALEKENSELKNAKDAARFLRKENDHLRKAQNQQQQRDTSNSVSYWEWWESGSMGWEKADLGCWIGWSFFQRRKFG